MLRCHSLQRSVIIQVECLILVMWTTVPAPVILFHGGEETEWRRTRQLVTQLVLHQGLLRQNHTHNNWEYCGQIQQDHYVCSLFTQAERLVRE